MVQVLCPVLVGRQVELRALDDALDAACNGRGGCAVVTGEPGIGKSRLVRELVVRAGQGGVPVVSGRAVPSAVNAPYRPLTEALLQLLRDRAVPPDPALAPWLAALGPLLPALAGEAAQPVSPAIRGEAVLQLLRRLAPGGLVLVLEDLHWADRDTVAVVEYLTDNLPATPVLCVMTLRTDPVSAAFELSRRQRGRAGITAIELDRLDEHDSAVMVAACAPGADAQVLQRVQRAAEGVPLLVEELLASPGLPASLNETVRERLADLPPHERAVIDAAAVLGRHFDWELLGAVSGQPADVVSAALGDAADRLLVTADGGTFRFRHALTREAVLEAMLPPRHRELAGTALAVLDASDRVFDRELAADLAGPVGQRQRAGALLAASGRRSLEWGALGTAIDALRRASDLLEGATAQADAELALVEALALAGRVEEAVAVGVRLIARLSGDPGTEATRVEVHLRLAQAGVAAARWQMARHQLDAARTLAGPAPDPGVVARMDVLAAEVAFSDDDYDAARELADAALATAAPADVRCHALEIVGRSHRLHDLPAARAAFEQALVTADAADLTLWRLRALHELGTVDLFDHAGVARLVEARRAAEEMGALGTAAVLDLQLAAAYTCRWALDRADAHSHSAIALADRLALDVVRAKALGMLVGAASMRADADGTERWIALTRAAAPDDRALEGLCWGGRGVLLIVAGDPAAAVEPYERGMAVFARLPHAEPAALRALWPLLLASLGDRRAERAVDEARRLGVAAFNLNRGLVGYAEAVMAGRTGDRRRADELVAAADTGFVNADGWADLARVLAAERAMADGWGDAPRWLASAADGFARRGLDRLAARCRDLVQGTEANPWAGAGVTAREADVLRLVAEGLPNKEIAARLRLSPRTVEKHVESLLRKTGARSRTELALRLTT
jgi:DNA-binding CsgD family transcriptional regulator